MTLEVKRICLIDDVNDLIMECELRDDMIKVVNKLDEWELIDTLLEYFDEIELNDVDNIYDYFLEQGDEYDILKELYEMGEISKEDYDEIMGDDEED